jgi:hypothetical protein
VCGACHQRTFCVTVCSQRSADQQAQEQQGTHLACHALAHLVQQRPSQDYKKRFVNFTKSLQASKEQGVQGQQQQQQGRGSRHAVKLLPC